MALATVSKLMTLLSLPCTPDPQPPPRSFSLLIHRHTRVPGSNSQSSPETFSSHLPHLTPCLASSQTLSSFHPPHPVLSVHLLTLSEFCPFTCILPAAAFRGVTFPSFYSFFSQCRLTFLHGRGNPSHLHSPPPSSAVPDWTVCHALCPPLPPGNICLHQTMLSFLENIPDLWDLVPFLCCCTTW